MTPPTNATSPRPNWRAPGSLRGLSMVLLLILAFLVNLFFARTTLSIDLTADRRNTLDPSTRGLLESLKTPVTLTVLIARSEPLAAELEPLLEMFRRTSNALEVDWVDPDRDPARFAARQSELGITAGRTEDDRVVTDSVIVVSSQSRHYYITTDDLGHVHAEQGTLHLHLEPALSLGIRRVTDPERLRVCFSTGQREIALEDRSADGLFEFGERLRRNDLVVEALPLEAGSAKNPDCRLVVVAGPEIPLGVRARQQLIALSDAGASLLLLGGLVVDESQTLGSAGFDELAQRFGVSLTHRLIKEHDEERLLPGLDGETFIATARKHPLTEGLLREATRGLDVVVSMAQALSVDPGAAAHPLLVASPHATTVERLVERPDPAASPLVKGDHAGQAPATGPVVAVAAEPRPGSEKQNTLGPPESRLIVMPVSLVTNRFLTGPEEMGARAFVDSVTSWLLRRPRVDPELAKSAPRPTRLLLSDADLSRIVRYVVVIMPGVLALLGALILTYRRRTARQITRPLRGTRS